MFARRFLKSSVPALTLLAAASCSSEASHQGGESDLTSVTALSRTMKFEGVVYVDANASEETILSTVRKQTQSAFGALRMAKVGVNSRELREVDITTFKKSNVTVIDALPSPRCSRRTRP